MGVLKDGGMNWHRGRNEPPSSDKQKLREANSLIIYQKSIITQLRKQIKVLKDNKGGGFCDRD